MDFSPTWLRRDNHLHSDPCGEFMMQTPAGFAVLDGKS
jgi:hypothetical protein